jgi:hypothetical protein
MLVIQFENEVSAHMAEICNAVVAGENTASDDDDSRLDHAAYQLRQYSDLWIHRGGNHIGIHFKDVQGKPFSDRAAIITAH